MGFVRFSSHSLAFVVALGLGLGPVSADDFDVVVRVSSVEEDNGAYAESFPTDARATALLWSKLKINALEEQTQALRQDWEQQRGFRVQRAQDVAASVGIVPVAMQAQLSVSEQFFYSSYTPTNRGYPGIRW